jgi:hypothetical protein
MVNRERFTLDLDSEGFVHEAPFAALNVGKLPDIELPQALLMDAKCLGCPPSEDNAGVRHCDEYPSDVSVETKKAVAAYFLRGKVDMDVPDQDLFALHYDGIGKLSDSMFPDAYFGWKR